MILTAAACGCLSATLKALPARNELETCGFESARFSTLMLPVFPADPLDQGPKREIVFDLLVSAEGTLTAKGAVYAPSADFVSAIDRALVQSTFAPARECDKPVAGLLRHTVADYFYPPKPDPTGATRLAQPLWVLDSKMINQFDSVCRYVADSRETQIRFRIDTTGTITKVEGMDPVSDVLVKGFFKPAQSMLRFSPATRSGKEVDSQLILRLSVPDRSTPITEKDPGERKLTPMPIHSVDTPKQVTATIHFDADGEILVARVDEGTPTALGTAVIQAVRSWRYPAEGPAPSIITCRFGFEPGQPEAFLLDEPEEVIRVIPEPIKQVSLIYPNSLARIGVEGIVRALFVVDTDGMVRDIEIIRSSHHLFSEAAIKSLEGWRFTPGTYDGEPASFRMMLPLSFKVSR